MFRRYSILIGAVFALGACSRFRSSKPPELRTASTHPMQYYVSLPPDWSPARTWPVVVAIASSEKDWEATAASFAKLRDRNKYPFIIVAPVILSNGGRKLDKSPAYHYDAAVWERADREKACVFDFEGIRAAVSDVEKQFHGESKFFMTGWSGGGHLANAVVLLHPETLRGAAMSSSNYSGRCVTGASEKGPYDDTTHHAISTAPERADLPVRYFNGTKDQYATSLIPARDEVMKVEADNGFRNVKAIEVPGQPHSAMAEQVLEFFSSLLAPSERLK